jgi:hypothetical protein
VTDVALKEYFERRIDDLEKHVFRRIDDMDRRYAQWLDLNDEAINKAEQTMNARLNAMNEFREALKDQANRMATRVELQSMADQVEELRRNRANLDGRLAVVSGGVSLVISLAIWFLSRASAP